jgi:methionine biosynthesis protein MetW
MLSRNDKPATWRVDHVQIANMVKRGARVLDVGCGDGELLRLLAETKDVDGRGIEISREGVNAGVAKGLAVIQGDADIDLADYPDDAFDYVILSQARIASCKPLRIRFPSRDRGKAPIDTSFSTWTIFMVRPLP